MIKSLVQIQNELRAPKNLRNTFANYSYRSCESILEALKPLLRKYDCQLTLSDDIVAVGNRVYIKTTAVLIDPDGNKEVVTAFAREAEEKRGMEVAMLSGASSSYCHKYALQNLFLVDDNKDVDSDEFHVQTRDTKADRTDSPDRRINAREIAKLKTAILQSGRTLEQALSAAKCADIESMTLRQYRWIIDQCA